MPGDETTRSPAFRADATAENIAAMPEANPMAASPPSIMASRSSSILTVGFENLL